MAKSTATEDRHSISSVLDTTKAVEMVVHSATLHARTLEAELRYLHDSDFMTKTSKEMDAVKSALSALLPHIPPQLQLQSKPMASAAENGLVLAIPEEYTVKKHCVGPNHEYLIANPGDRIILHARIEGHAIACNPRNETGGRIENSCLDPNEIGAQLEVPPSIIVLNDSSTLAGAGRLQW